MKFIQGGICGPKGFLAAAVGARIKKGRKGKDLALIFSEVPATAAGVFTTNKIQAACVTVSKKHLKSNSAQAIIANSGNANCCTGRQGLQDAEEMALVTARALGIKPDDVLVASTGIIGKYLPMGRIINNVPALVKRLTTYNSKKVAGAIMTTDTKIKEIAVRFKLGKQSITIGGIAKGSGMIYPNMATMLSFITTDAAIDTLALKTALKDCVNRTFNCISVDGDTSTNDMAFILANAAAGNKQITVKTRQHFEKFTLSLLEVTKSLAKMIVKDGEGATKLIEVCVKGAKTEKDAKLAAAAVSNSNLVKTAIYGQDANWGRLAAAVGRSGAGVVENRLDIFLGKIKIFSNGSPTDADESALKEILSKDEVKIDIDLGLGKAARTMWTCDLSEEYIKINAKYRT